MLTGTMDQQMGEGAFICSSGEKKIKSKSDRYLAIFLRIFSRWSRFLKRGEEEFPEKESQMHRESEKLHNTNVPEVAIVVSPEREEPIHDSNSQAEKNGEAIILVVGDNNNLRQFVMGTLEMYYTVVEAVDGDEGLVKARKIKPDLIISDIAKPITDDYELCRILKDDVDTCHIPVILLSDRNSDADIIAGFETGADDYITKPFNHNLFLSRIRNLVCRRRQLKDKFHLIPTPKKKSPSVESLSLKERLLFERFREIVEGHFEDSELDINKICKKLRVGRSTLFKKVKAIGGCSPNQYLTYYRLERGMLLIRENYGNITDVALAVGFSTASYFSKCFKEKYGKSPSAFQPKEEKDEKEFF